MLRLPDYVLRARERLLCGVDDFRRRHDDGCGGVELCRAVCDLRDEVLRDLFAASLAEVGDEDLRDELALVAHGGYGRRDVAPFSDVDLMILHPRGLETRVAPLARRFCRDVVDASLSLGHSARTPGSSNL